ncbi:hypothetical protein CYMTET_49905 [Cymbomonas tetramitiformis]|uniref:Inositol polyphosphate-related phosphatase domain-containing protein n=1 Tax=Cymbomonas tetramitiformis TaxID=36881 RepID=A0AAE0BQF8_9CHLO|nr:hypothetical protein CYMTET_49905 [Cymbomonas tetramitiformis]
MLVSGGASALLGGGWELKYKGQRPHFAVCILKLSQSGSRMWSAGATNIVVWDTRTGVAVKAFPDEPEHIKPPKMESSTSLMRTQTRQGSSFHNPSARGEEVHDAICELEEEEEVKASTGLLNASFKGAKAAYKGTKVIGNMTYDMTKDTVKSMNHTMKSTASTVKKSVDTHILVKLHVRCMAAAADTTMWIAAENGRIDWYTHEGLKLQEITLPPISTDGGGSSGAGSVEVRSLGMVGLRMWAGLDDGRVCVLTGSMDRPVMAEVRLIGQWCAHNTPVRGITVCGGRVCTLAQDGSIRSWNPMAPGDQDELVFRALSNSWSEFCSTEKVRVLCGTWNVGEARPFGSALRAWLSDTAVRADLVAIGLQEVEMGGSSLVSAASKEMFARKQLEKGNENAVWWQTALWEVLDESCGGMSSSQFGWEKVGLRQMSGMLVAVFARRRLMPHISEPQTSSVACGLLGVGGNKGAVAMRFMMFRRMVCIVCSHFAAHQGAVAKRNADYQHICSNLRFSGPNGTSGVLHGMDPVPDSGVRLEASRLRHVCHAACNVVGGGPAQSGAVAVNGDGPHRE